MSAQLLQYVVDENNIDLDQQQIRRVQDIISSGGKLPQHADDAWQLQVGERQHCHCTVVEPGLVSSLASMQALRYSTAS